MKVESTPSFGGCIGIKTHLLGARKYRELEKGIKEIYDEFLPKAEQFGNDMFIGAVKSKTNSKRMSEIIIATGGDNDLYGIAGSTKLINKVDELDAKLSDKIANYLKSIGLNSFICRISESYTRNSGKITKAGDYVIVNRQFSTNKNVKNTYVFNSPKNKDTLPVTLTEFFEKV